MLTSEQPALQAVAEPLATSSVSPEKERTENTHHPETAEASADVIALCHLITRILMRILHEHNDQVLQRLFIDESPRPSQRRNTL